MRPGVPLKEGLVGFLTEKKAKEDFFELLQKGDIFEYSMNDFMYQDVEEAALKRGVEVDYCKPGTDEYNTFGCFVCKVVGFTNGKGAEKITLPKFNPDELML